MVRHALRLLGLTVLVVGGAAGLMLYRDHVSAERQIERLIEKNLQYEKIVARLSTERRVADLLVTDQRMIDGVPVTNLLFVEYAKDGSTLPPKSFTIEGEMAHLDAKVIKFENDFVKEDDPLRGHSIALFTKIYGDRQTPEDGHPIDEPGRIPQIYRDSDPQVSTFETELWENFWRLLHDTNYRQQYGVRIAQGEGLWWPPEPDRLYTVTIESDGGLNLSWEPVKGIYQQAMKSAASRPATAPAD